MIEKGIIVGAYTSSPNLYGWDKSLEKEFFKKFNEIDNVRGLEIPFWGDSLHPNDDDYFLSLLKPEWEHVITCVPGTVKELELDPWFGLASLKEKSRKNAIEFVNSACHATGKLANHFEKNCVIAVELTSSPKTLPNSIKGDVEKLYESLLEISKWDWRGAKLVIEHCDSYSEENKEPQKGFLSLNDELQVIKRLNEEQKVQFGLTINWGRSAIEGKKIDEPENHIEYASNCGVLSGVMFSGVSANEDSLYGAWRDQHTPPPKAFDIQHFEESSLMSYDNIRNTINSLEIEDIDYIGIKLLPLPADLPVSYRIGINNDAITLIRKAIDELTEKVNFKQ
jgi:hypothetical protein